MGRKKHPVPEGVPDEIIVTDTLDLHGFFPEQVPGILEDFIQNALHLGLTSVKIIHGKGRSRLKYEVHKALQAHPSVADFRDAAPSLGGWGATVVELGADDHTRTRSR